MKSAPPRNERAIGVFDSGVGGLTVMRAIADELPGEDLIYLGDTARVPYGNRGPQTIRRYAQNAAHFLTEQSIKALVIACNTATAFALDHLKELFDGPVLGVVEPVAAAAAAHTKSSSVGVIGTRGTIASDSYRSALAARGVDRITQIACPLFVPLAEEGWSCDPVTRTVADRYFEGFESSGIDTLILGCTHYPILREVLEASIREIMGHDVALLDSATTTSLTLRSALEDADLVAPASNEGQITCFATDDPDRFAQSAARFFGSELNRIDHVDLVDVSSTAH